MPYLTETELSNYFQTIEKQESAIATLTAFNESMQTDARKNTETIRKQAAEIERLKNEIIRFSDLSHNIVSYMAAYNSPEREKESNERIDVQINAIMADES